MNKEVNSQKKEIDNLKKEIDNLKKELYSLNKKYNNKINSFNKKIKIKNYTKKKYNSIIKQFNNELKFLKNKDKKLKNFIKNSNKNVSKLNKFNLDIVNYQKKYNLNQLEALGRTYFLETNKEKEPIKIDIYGYENLENLKVVLAHEIGHMFGLEHINQKNALMNAILQEEQRNHLNITKYDSNYARKYLKNKCFL
jgi:predicted Zn-dependent protease